MKQDRCPDLIDITHDYLLKKFPHLYYEIARNSFVTGGKVMIVKHTQDKDYDLRALGDNHIFSLSVNGTCWHHPTASAVPLWDVKLYPANPDYFEMLESFIRRSANAKNR